MSYGLNIYDANGRLNLNSNSMALSVVDVFHVGAQSGGSKSYPGLAGRTIQIQTAGRAAVGWSAVYLPYEFSVDYGLGYPRISWALNAGLLPGGAYYFPQVVYVALLQIPAGSDYGFKAFNGSGEVIASYTSKNYRYLGLATLQSNVGNGSYVNGYMTASIYSPGGDPLFFVENLQGQKAVVQTVDSSGSTYTARVSKDTDSVPRVLCFGPHSSNSPGAGYGLAVWGPSGELLLDSTVNILASPLYVVQTTPSTAISGGTALYSMPGISALGAVGGSVPTNSACMATATAFYGAEVNKSGNRYLKDHYVAIMRSGATFYSGWVVAGYRQFPYETFYPIASNLGYTPRVYVVDIDQYT